MIVMKISIFQGENIGFIWHFIKFYIISLLLFIMNFMSIFLKEIPGENGFELMIDTSIFSKDIILKAAYNFLDRGYFFFRFDENKNIILECRKKAGVNIATENIIWEYSDELLSVYLRDTLERENKAIREAIVTKAINGPLDMQNFVSLDTDAIAQTNEIDFDKDIDEILREIENDPDLKIDEEEIEKILKEIEQETESMKKPSIQINPEWLKDIKNMFQKNK